MSTRNLSKQDCVEKRDLVEKVFQSLQSGTITVSRREIMVRTRA